jgi:hypothetical protein
MNTRASMEAIAVRLQKICIRDRLSQPYFIALLWLAHVLCQRRVNQSLIVSDLAEPSAVSETIKVPRRLPTMR